MSAIIMQTERTERRPIIRMLERTTRIIMENAAKTGDTMPVIPIASAVAAFAVIAEIIRRRIKNR